MIANLLNKTITEQSAIYSQAVQLLKSGELVAFPTETVYGLGADANNPEAVAKIFSAKGRPADHPVIVHIGDIEQLSNWAKKIPDIANLLIEKFWPGPLTLILPAAHNVPAIITGGQTTIGVRMPGHPVAQQLLKSFGGAIAAPSANKFGRISPTSAQHVADDLGNDVKLILDGGNCALGLESTIIDLTAEHPRILRPGPLTPQIISNIIHEQVDVLKKNNVENIPRVSGNLLSHYAPQTPLKILTFFEIKNNIAQYLNKYQRVVILSQQKLNAFNDNVHHEIMPDNPKHYGQQLYATLRKVDQMQFDLIIVEQLPFTDDWLAVRDRLQRAAS